MPRPVLNRRTAESLEMAFHNLKSDPVRSIGHIRIWGHGAEWVHHYVERYRDEKYGN